MRPGTAMDLNKNRSYDVTIVLNVLLLLILSPLLAYALALHQIFFTTIKEGTAISVVRGGNFSHLLMAYKGHYLNDPRRAWFIKVDLGKPEDAPEWEVLPLTQEAIDKGARSAYAKWALHLRLLEKLGIYYYGFWPFFKVEERKFHWAERRVAANGNEEPWHREAFTKIFYVAAFSYWLRLVEAEDKDNVPVDLDYLLTVEITNPYKARYTVADWLARLTADANNSSKVWVAGLTFEDVVRERKETEITSGFVSSLMTLNTNLPTEQSAIGAPNRIGVRVTSAALQKVTIAGRDQATIAKATTASLIADRTARAAIITAEGNARVVGIGAAAEKNRIETVFGAITSNPAGVRLAEVEAIKSAAQSPGSTVIWAQNPGLAALGQLVGGQNPRPTPPPTINQTPPEEE